MYVNERNPNKPNPKATFPKKMLITGVGMVIVGWLVGFGADSLSQGSLLSQYWGGMLMVISGVIALIGWVIIAAWIVLYLRHRRKPDYSELCPSCGFRPPLPEDIFCRKCGTKLHTLI